MFDFQKLHVFQKAKNFTIDAGNLIRSGKFNKIINDQFRRASLSIMLNISVSAFRFSKKDRRSFLVIARGSAFECAAILEYLEGIGELKKEKFEKLVSDLEEISKMLFSLIKKLEN